MDHLEDIASQYDFVDTEVIGQSWEGRDLKILKICKSGCGTKPAIWIDGGWCPQIKILTLCFLLTLRYPCEGVDQPGHGAVDHPLRAG